VYNKFENVMSFLKTNGIRGLVGKNDWPRYTEEEPEIWTDVNFAASTVRVSHKPDRGWTPKAY
jgi:hypothetical protein